MSQKHIPTHAHTCAHVRTDTERKTRARGHTHSTHTHKDTDTHTHTQTLTQSHRGEQQLQDFVPDCAGRCQRRPSVPTCNTQIDVVVVFKSCKLKRQRNSLIILTQTFNNGRSLLCADTVKCPPVLQLSVLAG